MGLPMGTIRPIVRLVMLITAAPITPTIIIAQVGNGPMEKTLGIISLIKGTIMKRAGEDFIIMKMTQRLI